MSFCRLIVSKSSIKKIQEQAAAVGGRWVECRIESLVVDQLNRGTHGAFKFWERN